MLHLAVRDRVRLEEFDTALAGGQVSWKGLEGEAMAAVNESHLAPLRAHSWEDALRLLQATREQLVSALVAVPAEPAGVWLPEHPFGAMLHRLPEHDRHHAEQIKDARISSQD